MSTFPKFNGFVPDRHRAIQHLRAVPCLHALSLDVSIRVSSNPARPFFVENGKRVLLHEGCLSVIPLAILLLRHALELALWQRLLQHDNESSSATSLSIDERAIAAALLAAGVAGNFFRMMDRPNRDQCALQLPTWLRSVYESQTVDLDSLTNLLSLQRAQRTCSTAPCVNEIGLRAVMQKVQAVAVPVEQLLVQDGDHRLNLLPSQITNIYGIAPTPVPGALIFSSSTASPISEIAHAHVEHVRQRIIAKTIASSLHEAARTEAEAVRDSILMHWGIPGASAILAASGTDAELIALCLSAIDSPVDLTNILIAPEETGKGVLLAALGRHFSNAAPFTSTVQQGTRLPGLGAVGITSRAIPIRTACGNALSQTQIDDLTSEAVTEEINAGRRVVLHLLDDSKSGLGGPGSDVATALASEFPDRVQVVVDSCQQRTHSDVVKRHLQQGRIVLLTGSKFLGGPAFAGAVLLPSKFREQCQGQDLPAGMAAYTARLNWPLKWQARCKYLPDAPNVGLILRWQAALCQKTLFDTVPDADKYSIIASLGGFIRSALESDPDLIVLADTGQDRDREDQSRTARWDSLASIFTFGVAGQDSKCRSAACAIEQLQDIYSMLQCDLGSRLPPSFSATDRQLGAARCYVGQAVKLGDTAGLRICIGARTVSEIFHNRLLGQSIAERIVQERSAILTILRKIKLIIRYQRCVSDSSQRPGSSMLDTSCVAGNKKPTTVCQAATRQISELADADI